MITKSVEYRVEMAGVFDIELHDENVDKDDSDDDGIEIEEVSEIIFYSFFFNHNRSSYCAKFKTPGFIISLDCVRKDSFYIFKLQLCDHQHCFRVNLKT